MVSLAPDLLLSSFLRTSGLVPFCRLVYWVLLPRSPRDRYYDWTRGWEKIKMARERGENTFHISPRKTLKKYLNIFALHRISFY